MSLIPTPEAKKASNEEIITTISKLSDILISRYDSDPDSNIDQHFRYVLSNNCYSDPNSAWEPFFVDDIMVIIPSLPKTGSKGGDSVLSMVQIPGSEPYAAHDAESPTYRDSQTLKLRGFRSASLHSIIPGMIISFHHYSTVSGTNYRDRVAIDAGRVMYRGGEAVFEAMSEEDALFNIPDPGKMNKGDIYS